VRHHWRLGFRQSGFHLNVGRVTQKPHSSKLLPAARGIDDRVKRRTRPAQETPTEGRGSITPTPFGPQAEDLDPGQAARGAERWRSLLIILERHAIVESGLPLAAFPTPQRRGLVDTFGQIGTETMALARRPGRALWTMTG